MSIPIMLHADVERVPFVPKHDGSRQPWKAFGTTQTNYEHWVHHVCGICGLAMALKAAGLNAPSLWNLTRAAASSGVFNITPTGEILGAYHKPLARLSARLGLPAQPLSPLGIREVKQHVSHGCLVLLSVQLERVSASLHGSHLLLIHTYQPDLDVFKLHDCAHAVRAPGENAIVGAAELDRWSNARGLVFDPT